MENETEIRRIAQDICRVATKDCVADEDPVRAPCTADNCRVYQIAERAVADARRANR